MQKQRLVFHCRGIIKERTCRDLLKFLNEWQNKNLLGIDIKGCLEKIIKNLDAVSGELQFKFKYFVEKKAPVTQLPAQMAYECTFEGRIDTGNTSLFLVWKFL